MEGCYHIALACKDGQTKSYNVIDLEIILHFDLTIDKIFIEILLDQLDGEISFPPPVGVLLEILQFVYLEQQKTQNCMSYISLLRFQNIFLWLMLSHHMINAQTMIFQY